MVTKRAEFGKTFDITFIFPENDGAMIFAEKQKLLNKSEVFEKQLAFSSPTDDGAECVETEESIPRIPRIAIKDISFETFCNMMGHIYREDGEPIDIYESNYSELLYASRKYFIDDLTEKIIEFLESFINAQNLADHFDCIDSYEIKMLNDIVKGVCVKSPLEVIGNITFTTSGKRILELILESPYLPCSEFKLYNAILSMLMKEDENEKNLRKKLGKLIYLIRFPTMTVPELVSCGQKPSLLTTEQLVDFQLWVQHNIFSNTLQFFSKVPRHIILGSRSSVSVFGASGSGFFQ